MNNLTYNWSWERIDTWLTSKFDYSRNFFHHIISRWWVSIRAKAVKKSYKLKNWDEIVIDDLKRYISPVILDEAPNIDIPIVLEKEDYIVLNKPKWVLSHPNSVWDVKSPSVVGFLYHNYKDLPSVGDFIRAGLIHRLDKETDGLMIIVKTEKWLAHFKALFQEKSESEDIETREKVNLQKFYRAQCYINPEGQEFLDNIKWQLPYYIQEMVVPQVPHSVPKMGITKILNFDIKEDKLNINLQILTWRTHQIRYHLSNKWLPILGDYLYGKDEEVDMMLTAYKLHFVDPKGEEINLEI